MDGGEKKKKVKPFFIAPRISCRSSKCAVCASTQRDSTPPGAASSLRRRRGFGVGGEGVLGLEEGGRGMRDALGSLPTSTPSFMYLFTSRHIT